jgi:hypothetical protein
LGSSIRVPAEAREAAREEMRKAIASKAGSEWLRMAQNGSDPPSRTTNYKSNRSETRVFYDGLVMSEYFEANVLEL